MDEQLRRENLEKTRYQLGQIIKSWSKVERVVEDTYTAYRVDDDRFVYLHDEVILIPEHLLDRVSISHELVEIDEYTAVPTLSGSTVYRLSLDDHRFTAMIPLIEKAYRKIILANY